LIPCISFRQSQVQCLVSTSWKTLCAFSLDARIRLEMGRDSAMVIVKKGDCEHCGKFYRYSLWHSGFGDNSYAYCNDCGMLAIINYENPAVVGFPPLSTQCAEIDESWEPLLRPCVCGGTFRKGASPRCPACNEPLSAAHASAHIEAQAQGAGRGWRWQQSWSGVYCMAIDDPQNPGRPRQMVDPVITPESATAPKKRWSLLFSFGR
jgi:hypothetical protein